MRAHTAGRRTDRTVAIAVPLALFAGCSEDGSSHGKLTWYGNVAPVAYDECASCHREGGIGPFSVLDETEVQSNGASMKQHTADRHMPPMPVNNDGSCQTYQNARWLSAEEIALFGNWADSGMAMGVPEDAPPVPQPPAGLSDANVFFDIGTDYSPQPREPEKGDDYRCFVVRPGNTEDVFVTGYEVVPGDPRIVHHVILFSLPTPAADEQATILEGEDERPGYECFGGPRVDDAEAFAGWAPGGLPTEFPDGTGIHLPQGRKLVVQVHYNVPRGEGPFVDRSQIRMRTTTDASLKAAALIPIADLRLSLPPGQPDAIADATFPISSFGKVTVYGAFPHMHLLGRSLRVTHESVNGETRCLVDVDRWSFHWQGSWWYTTPVEFDSSGNIRIQCGYDTQSRSETVTWGEGTQDEMCLAFFYVTFGS